MSNKQEQQKEPVIIKKYANRRLYNTESSTYVTLENLSQMVKEGRDFVVKDAKTGDDITRSVLAQIIFEEESKGQTLLPVNFLRQLISFYGQGMESLVPGYLEATLEMFSRNQERYREYMEQQLKAAKAFAPNAAFTGPFEEIARQNMAAFERATRMFNPFPTASSPTPSAPSSAENEKSAQADTLEDLKAQLRAMQSQIDKLTGKESK